MFQHLEDKPTSTQELAESTSVEPALLRRILRHLAAHGTITEHCLDCWSATTLSKALAQPDGCGVVRRIGYANSLFNAGTAFLEQHGYKNPTDGRDTIFQYAFNCPEVNLMEQLQKPQYAAQAADFNHMMAFAARYRVSWMEVCSPGEMVSAAEKDDAAIAFVDIGGGLGLHIAEFRRRFPRSSLPARVVLQELPKVIEAARKRNEADGVGGGSLNEVELQEYDFWTPQPLRGAKIYFLSRIIHDWPDAQATKILANIADAMTKEYSKLLIQDTVIPDTGCPRLLSGLDLNMMAALASKERTESEWRALFEPQGLRIVKIHTVPSSTSAILEVELAN